MNIDMYIWETPAMIWDAFIHNHIAWITLGGGIIIGVLAMIVFIAWVKRVDK